MLLLHIPVDMGMCLVGKLCNMDVQKTATSIRGCVCLG